MHGRLLRLHSQLHCISMRLVIEVWDMRKTARYLILILVVGILLSLYTPKPIGASFTDIETVQATFTSGEWVNPEISSVFPCWGISGACMWLVGIIGDHLTDTDQVMLLCDGTNIVASKVDVICDSAISCIFNLVGAPPGTYSIVVQHSDGISSVCVDCFMIYKLECPLAERNREEPQKSQLKQAPQRAEEPKNQTQEEAEDDQNTGEPSPPNEGQTQDNFLINPKAGISGNIVDITIDGGPFSAGLQAHLKGNRSEAWSIECKFPSPTRMECKFNLYGMPAGPYELEVIDYKGNVIYLAGYFEIM